MTKKSGNIWSEIRTDFEDNGFIHIDAWESANDNEEGKVIAKVSISTGEVIYIDKRALTDPLAQESIELVRKDFCFNL
jgi:hypothetical protein